MNDLNTYIAFKKLFQSLVLDRYDVTGEIKVMDFSTDQYVDIEKTNELPQIGGIHVIYDLDLSRFHQCLENYDEKYAKFFEDSLWDDSIEKVLMYLPELPLYHEVYFRRTNVDKLLEEVPTMIDNINNLYDNTYKNLVRECKVTDIKYEDEGIEISKLQTTRMIVHNSCENTTINQLFAQIGTEMYPDMLWLVKTY